MEKLIGFSEKEEITNKEIIKKEEKRIAKRIARDIVVGNNPAIAVNKNEKIINTFSTLQEIEKDVVKSVEIFWWSYKMRLNTEKVYLAVLEILFPN